MNYHDSRKKYPFLLVIALGAVIKVKEKEKTKIEARKVQRSVRSISNL